MAVGVTTIHVRHYVCLLVVLARFIPIEERSWSKPVSFFTAYLGALLVAVFLPGAVCFLQGYYRMPTPCIRQYITCPCLPQRLALRGPVQGTCAAGWMILNNLECCCW